MQVPVDEPIRLAAREPQSASPRPRRLKMLLGVLLLLVVVGLYRFLHSPWYQEHRLRRMSAAERQAWTVRYPDDPLGHYYLGQSYKRAGEATKEAEAYAKALNLNPLESRARSELAGLLVASRQEKAAENLLLEGVRFDPGVAELHRGLGLIYEARQDFRRATHEWQTVTSLAPNDHNAWFRLGVCWMGMNDETRAGAAYQRAVELNPLSAAYQRAAAGALRLQGRLAEAEKHCRRALFLLPDDPIAHFELMKILRDRDGTTPEVEASMRHVVDLQPDNPQFRYYFGSILRDRGRLKEAAEAFETAIRLFEGNRPRDQSIYWNDWGVWLSYIQGSHFNLAHVLQRLGRAKEAATHLAQHRRLNRYQVRASQLFGQIGNRPKEPNLRFELARVHAAAGSVGMAIEQYRAGLRLRPDPRAQAELTALEQRERKPPPSGQTGGRRVRRE